MIKTKFITNESYGKIPTLGGITGPITSPCYVNIYAIISMINSGKVIYEVNPKNTKEKVRLTIDNVLKNNFDNDVKKDTPIKTNKVNTSNNVNKTAIKPVIENTSGNVNDTDNKIIPDLFIANKYS